MDLRNITRSMLFNRALRKFNKKGNHGLIGRDIYCLLAIHYLSGVNGCYRWQVYKYLSKLGRTYEMNRIEAVLDGLVNLGFIERRNKTYYVTLSGSVALGSFERILRLERYDR